MKDLFSEVSDLYATSRPGYPDEMVSFILSHVSECNLTWDVATGNGQLAGLLCHHFKEVLATDISKQQLSSAIIKDNIHYKIEQAEKSSAKDHSIDLVTIAQAIHWFNFEEFYKEVNRVLKPGGIIAALGYALIEVDKEVDEAIQLLYEGVLNDYWDPERKYIDEYYSSIPFPFEEIVLPEFSSNYEWTFRQLINNIKTWSAVGHYKKKHNVDPVKEIEPILSKAWGISKTKKVNFPIFGRLGRKL